MVSFSSLAHGLRLPLLHGVLLMPECLGVFRSLVARVLRPPMHDLHVLLLALLPDLLPECRTIRLTRAAGQLSSFGPLKKGG